MADDPTRTASDVCIYWQTSEDNPSLESEGAPGRCTATDYFSKVYITCYNDGNCDGAGTCRNCKAYDVSSAKLSHKDTTYIYGPSYLLEWNAAQEKYIPTRKLTEGETSNETAFVQSLTREQKVTSFNVSGEQVPANLAIYNLRASFKKCCNWSAPPFLFYKDRTGTLYFREFTSTGMSVIPYLAKNDEGEYPNAAYASRHCSVDAADPWKTPFTSENDCSYGCNGAKPECPYYTGPKWTYCVDSKMEMGDKVNAAQILELRYYSDDWSKYSYPEDKWRKSFTDPEIYAWTGKFEFGGDEAEDEDDNPLVQKVHISSFIYDTPQIQIGSPEPADKGIRVYGDVVESTVNFPTLVKELKEVSSDIKIVWPKNTTSSSPYEFKTFRIGQNVFRVYVDTPYVSSVYAVNLTKHPQGYTSDSDFLEDMLQRYPDDLYIVEGSGISNTLPYLDVELEYKPELNVIKVFTRDPTSDDGEYLTDTCYINHKIYHAMVAQTVGVNSSGNDKIQPWIDRFGRVHCEAQVLKISNAPSVGQVLWDTDAGGRLTVYPVEEVHAQETVSGWVSMGCSMAAVEFDNLACNAVTPWESFGTSPRGISLGMWVDRSNNTAASDDGVVPLKQVLKTADGSGMPGNVIIVEPDLYYYDSSGAVVRGPDGRPLRRSWSGGFDEKTDVIKATYYTTEYKQVPVEPEDVLKLKYPYAQGYYLDQMPLEMSLGGDSFSVSGSSLGVQKTKDDGSIEYGRIHDATGVKEYIYNRLLEEEIVSMESFSQGGVGDKDISTAVEIFLEVRNKFEKQYEGYVFCSDGQQVTLWETCQRLSDLKYHEGDYTFLFIFNDETGRPVGVKRISMLLQSATPETRDVEIRYRWEMKLLHWPILDSLLLLARYNKPMRPAEDYEGAEHYNPRCGDHSENLLASHIFGDPGPMWYPYESCLEPRYHEDNFNNAVKCQNYVEGFGSGNSNTGPLDGKRWSYWERMRGNDMLSTWVSSPIFLVGCFYREVSSSYQLTGPQTFDGYTRIRSSHPHAAFAKDREALRVGRHFVKRNLSVRNEIVGEVLSSDYGIGWTDEYKQLIFTDPNDPSKGILVGDEQQTPIWVHLSDGISPVNRTTSDRQHPFTHYLLESVGSYTFNETYDESDDNRYKLSEVLEDRDLTSVQARRPDGTLIYSPGDPVYMDEYQNYNDLLPVYKRPDIAWAWLEQPKDIVRGVSEIGGINLYNPSSNVWKTDRESAVYSDEGLHNFVYIAPEFDEETGLVTKNPSFSWSGGPVREINWYTGKWVEDYGVLSVYKALINDSGFNFFGKGSDGSKFLMDDSGAHKYVYNVTNEGVEYKRTARGVGVDSTLSCELLPFDRSELVNDVLSVYTEFSRLNEKLEQYASYTFTAPCGGYYYIESIDITWKYGIAVSGVEEGVRYDIPKTWIFSVALTPTEGIKVGLVALSEYERATSSEVLETEGEGGVVYTYEGSGYKKVTYSVGAWCSSLKFLFEGILAGAKANADRVEIWYRRPKDQTEIVKNYEQKVNISTGDTGTHDYRHMLYYYSRTYVDFGDGLAYNQLDTNFITSPNMSSIKFTSRSVKDVVLEYEYGDYGNVRFPYKSEVHPENSPLAADDHDGLRSVPDAIQICTKGRTLITNAHVNDCPEYVEIGGSSVNNPLDKAVNENSSCAGRVGRRQMGEKVQECLYNEARGLLGGDVTTTYKWFWHPDEKSFWEGQLGIVLPGTSLKLELKSYIPEMYRLFQHEHFGCSSQLAVPYYDGRLHEVHPWRALGHRLYVGNPKFNYTCYDVVVFKISDHMGERTYGTSEYGQGAAAGGAVWPYETYRDRNYYLHRGIIERGGYLGGAIGGAGPGFWAAQSQFSHGFTVPQLDTQRQIDEQIETGIQDSVRADASRSGMHSDGPVVY